MNIDPVLSKYTTYECINIPEGNSDVMYNVLKILQKVIF